MPAEQLSALLLLAIVGSFTPGPNTTIATVTGAHYGVRATVPHMLGVPFGFATMLVAGALGISAAMLATPLLPLAIKWIGIAYLLWIARQIAGSSASATGTVMRPFSFWQSAAFQFVNPKAWMLTMATVATFMGDPFSRTRLGLIVLVFVIAAFASLVLWAAVGAGLREWLAVGTRLRSFNRIMGLMLAATAGWMAFQ
ncbi:MAG: LysE family translocator [Burkholderiaceae bacterium]